MTPVSRIAARAAVCGVIACSLLAFFSSKMDAAQLTAAVHRHSLTLHEGWVQSAILAVGLTLAYALGIRDLSELHRRGGRRRLLYGAAETLAFFVLGFLIVGIFIPPHA
jgi:hypothetical protein